MLALLVCMLAACGGSDAETRAGGGAPGGGHRGGAGGAGGPPGGSPAEAGVPVEVQTISRSPISLFFETNGSLEAERDVDLVARAGGPIVALDTEEGQRVAGGQRLARIDDSEIRSQLAVAKIQLEEATSVRDRMTSLWQEQLVSREDFDRVVASYETALGDVERAQIQLEYTTIAAPFAGQIARRYVRLAQFVSVGTPLFRITSFDALQCLIQVPERELGRLRVGQPAIIEAEAFPDVEFTAKVLRISPVVETETGTVRVTLEVPSRERLRPGMFARVFLELERREGALVVPKSALALDSLGDALYVVDGGVARRRSVTLGFENADRLEVTEGVAEGEQVVVVGQDGLSDGTPIEILRRDGERLVATPTASPAAASRSANPNAGAAAPAPAGEEGRGRRGPGTGGPRGGPGGFQLDLSDPEQVERAKTMMRQRGLTDEQIKERLERIRARQSGDGGGER